MQTSIVNNPGVRGGVYYFDFDHAYMTGHSVPVGATVHAKFWSRDSGFPPPNSVGLTNAAAIETLP